MIKYAVFLACLMGAFARQNVNLDKHIVRTHANGHPYVVIYTQGEQNERVREELYYSNGNLDYAGNYQNGMEHGEWIYYWENGNMKSYEMYEDGLEQGVGYEYDYNGKKIKELHYLNGILVKELDL